MARAIAKCKCLTCGQEFEKIAFKRNRSEANDWESWAEGYFDECSECYKKRIDEENAAKSSGLPQLTGTEKQIKWAMSIRLTFINDADKNIELLKKNKERFPEDSAEYETAIAIRNKYKDYILSNRTDSKYWIENRGYSEGFFFRDAKKSIQESE